MSAGYVYFIQHGTRRGPVKIGFSTSPKTRLSALQMATPASVRLLAVEEADDRSLERSLHARFADLRVRGEWFLWAEPLRSYVNGLPRREPTSGYRMRMLKLNRPEEEAFRELRRTLSSETLLTNTQVIKTVIAKACRARGIRWPGD